MKKIAYGLLVVFGIILLTGCGRNINFNKVSHLTCKKTEVSTNDTTTSIMTLAYDKNERVTDFKVEESITYNKQMSQEALQITEKTMKLIGKIPGINFESKVGDNSLYFNFSGNIKMLKTIMKQLDKNYTEAKVYGDTKTEALTSLAKEGYSCQDIKK